MVEINEKVAKFIEEYLQVLEVESTQPILKTL
jgi:spermidine synthase